MWNPTPKDFGEEESNSVIAIKVAYWFRNLKNQILVFGFWDI